MVFLPRGPLSTKVVSSTAAIVVRRTRRAAAWGAISLNASPLTAAENRRDLALSRGGRTLSDDAESRRRGKRPLGESSKAANSAACIVDFFSGLVLLLFVGDVGDVGDAAGEDPAWGGDAGARSGSRSRSFVEGGEGPFSFFFFFFFWERRSGPLRRASRRARRVGADDGGDPPEWTGLCSIHRVGGAEDGTEECALWKTAAREGHRFGGLDPVGEPPRREGGVERDDDDDKSWGGVDLPRVLASSAAPHRRQEGVPEKFRLVFRSKRDRSSATLPVFGSSSSAAASAPAVVVSETERCGCRGDRTALGASSAFLAPPREEGSSSTTASFFFSSPTSFVALGGGESFCRFSAAATFLTRPSSRRSVAQFTMARNDDGMYGQIS
mmetsp:Transcript_1766/g.5956  ORF Transcript_1766/g.5956 Transcript_1766/m.5956 type:complete len:383 (+) Transcript_1766:205-1353(+)